MSFNNLTGLAASRVLDTTVKSFHIDYNVKNMANNIVMTLYGDVWLLEAFPGDSVVKNLPANAGDTGVIPGSGRSPGGGNGNILQYSCLENSMERSLGGYSPEGHKESDMTQRLNSNSNFYTINTFKPEFPSMKKIINS